MEREKRLAKEREERERKRKQEEEEINRKKVRTSKRYTRYIWIDIRCDVIGLRRYRNLILLTDTIF